MEVGFGLGREEGDCVNDCFVTECFLVLVFDLTASSDSERESFLCRLRFFS